MGSLVRRIPVLLVLLAFPTGRAWAQAPAQLLTITPGWSVSIAPYLWLPGINTRLGYDLPDGAGRRLPTDVNFGNGQVVSGLHFALMGAAEIRYERVSLLTDFVYASTGGGSSRFREIDAPGALPYYITPSLQSSGSVTLKPTIWTEAGGYTVLAGDWGNLDVLAGFRLLALSTTTNYGFAAVLTGPFGGNAGLGKYGSLSKSGDIWNGIAGLRGSVRLGTSAFFVPYYFDIGGGGSRLTWQVAAGIGYQGDAWAISATYRALVLDQDSRAVAATVTIRGPVITLTFQF